MKVHRALVASAAVVAVIMLSAGPLAAGTPGATVRPYRHLANGQVVTVNWHGFNVAKAKAGLLIVECTPNWFANVGNQCDDDADEVLLRPPIQARGSATLALDTGLINSRGNVTCGTSESDNNCVILVADLDKHSVPVPGESIAVPITFTLPG